MLQQILKDMYIDPELLAELDETQKQTLFCRMREEQVRRWRIWDQEENVPIEPRKPKSISCKKVQWLLDEEGEPWTVVINDFLDQVNKNDETYSDNNYDDSGCLRDSREKKIDDTNGDADIAVNDSSSDDSTQDDDNSNPTVPDDNPNSINLSLDIANANDKREALQELSLNKVKNIIQIFDREKKIEANNISDETIVVKPEDTDNEKRDILWREQQKKAKEAEIHLRSVARRAREEHRRSIAEAKSDAEEQINVPCERFIYSDYGRSEVIGGYNGLIKPPNREAISKWFKSEEICRGSGIASDGISVAPWFHGLITRQEAELLLRDKQVGTFLVRISERIWGYAISYKDRERCKHYLIDCSNQQYRFLGNGQLIHESLGSLIEYHSAQPITIMDSEILRFPCPRSKYSEVAYLFQRG